MLGLYIAPPPPTPLEVHDEGTDCAFEFAEKIAKAITNKDVSLVFILFYLFNLYLLLSVFSVPVCAVVFYNDR